MPAIIDSAPDCIIHINGAKPPDDSADFILQAAYAKCHGIMTFGPGTAYGEGGSAATTSYYVLTVIGMVVTLIVIIAWVLSEDRRLRRHVARITRRGMTTSPATDI